VKSFEVDTGTAAGFIGRVRQELVDRRLNQYVELNGNDSELVVKFRWMGSTELRYRIEPGSEGFQAHLIGESVSPFHAPFRKPFDDRFDEILAKVGAKTLNV
jgi:hypothetical protein